MRQILCRAALRGSVAACCLTLWSCGSSGPTAPTPPPTAPSSIGSLEPAGTWNSGTVTWSCFTAKGNLFLSGVCGAAARLVPNGIQVAAATPFAPGGLTHSVSGETVTLTWVAATTTATDPVTSYLIEAGTATGLADITDNFDTRSAQPTFKVTSVPAGTYYVRLRARNGSGLSLPSNEVVVVVLGPPCAGAPGTPNRLTATVNGSTVTLSWSAPTSGCAPTTYQIEAGSTAGAANLVTFFTGNTQTSYTATNVMAGTYYVRVRAGTAIVGPTSNETVVVVPGA